MVIRAVPRVVPLVVVRTVAAKEAAQSDLGP